MDQAVDWETNVYAGLEQLDDEGQERVSQLRGQTPDADELPISTGLLQDLGELELAAQPPRLA